VRRSPVSQCAAWLITAPLIAVLLCAFGITAASSATTRAAGAAGPLRMTVGTLGSIGSLDPRHGSSEIAEEVWNLQYPTLTSLDPQTLDAAPGLATGWSPTPGGHGWIYNLSHTLTWSDGKPVTASDVVYSLEHARDGRWPYAVVAGVSSLSGLTARVVNPHSVAVTSTGSDPLPGLLLHVVPAHVFSTTPNLDANVARLGVADGTWHVVAKTDDSVELDATAGAAGPALQQIVFRTYPNASALLDALSKKQVDVVSDVPDSDLGRLEAIPNVTVDHAGNGTQFLLRDRLTNARDRQAISLAIDRDQLVTSAVNGVGTPGVVPIVARGSQWAPDDATVQSLTASLDGQPGRARQVLSGAPVTRRLVVSIPSDPVGRKVGAFVRNALHAVGVETTAVDSDVSEVGNRPPPDLVVYRGFITDDPFTALRLISCDACSQDPNPPPSTLPAQLATVQRTLAATTAQATVVGLFQPDTLQAFTSDRLTGFLPEPQDRSLVVFAPTVAQYSRIGAAGPPPGEQSSNTTYALGAVLLLAICGATLWVASRIRAHYVT
jgi:peptide/nickel transport system substrate-binding protein